MEYPGTITRGFRIAVLLVLAVGTVGHAVAPHLLADAPAAGDAGEGGVAATLGLVAVARALDLVPDGTQIDMIGVPGWLRWLVIEICVVTKWIKTEQSGFPRK